MKKMIGLVALAALASCGGGKKDHSLVVANTDSLNFGNVTLTTTKTNLLTVENNGEHAVIFQQAVIDHDGSNFEVNDLESTCKSGETVAPNQTCILALDFTPTNDVRFVDSFTIKFSATDKTEEASWKVKSYNLEGTGFLNCNAKSSWVASYDLGVGKAQQKMADETVAAKKAADAKTPLDGYKVGFPLGYQERYQSNYNSAYISAYNKAFNTAYNNNKYDYFACADGRSDANKDAKKDADTDAYILGTEEGYEDGYIAGDLDGYDWGYYESSNSCGYDYAGSASRSLQNQAPSIDSNTDAALAGKCEAQGYSNTYVYSHYTTEYNKFLLQNMPYQNGIADGRADGRIAGTEDGLRVGDADGKRDGNGDGTQAGLDESYNVCYAEKYATEYNYQYNLLYPKYYNAAYAKGDADGFEDGYEDGWYDAQYEVCGYSYSKPVASAAKESGLIQILEQREDLVASTAQGKISVAKTKLTRIPLILKNSEDPMMNMIYQGFENYVKDIQAKARANAQKEAVVKQLKLLKAPKLQ